jgi:uridine phosphorylase
MLRELDPVGGKEERICRGGTEGGAKQALAVGGVLEEHKAVPFGKEYGIGRG